MASRRVQCYERANSGGAMHRHRSGHRGVRRRSARGRRRGGGCKILHRGAKFLIPATSGVGFVIAAGGSMMATCAAAGVRLVLHRGATPSFPAAPEVPGFIGFLHVRSAWRREWASYPSYRMLGVWGRPDVGLVRQVSPLMPRNRHRQFFRLTALPEAVIPARSAFDTSGPRSDACSYSRPSR